MNEFQGKTEALIEREEDLETLKTLRSQAENTPLPIEVVRELAHSPDAEERGRIADESGGVFSAELSNGITVTFAHEQQPIGLCRHVYVSMATGFPPSTLLNEILQVLGYRYSLMQIIKQGNEYVFSEKIDNEQVIVHVIEPMAADPKHLH